MKHLDPRRYLRRIGRLYADRHVNRLRRAVESRYGAPTTPRRPGAPVVVCEGMWDNPNHFFRLHLILSAMPEARSSLLVGVLRRRADTVQRRSLESLGVADHVYLEDDTIRAEHFADEARRLLAGVATHQDLLALALPRSLPAYVYYDTVLKQARHPQPPLDSPLWPRVLQEVLRNLAIYDRLFSERSVRAVLLSHPWKNEFATLCWTALAHHVPCYYATGFCESTRIRRFASLADFATPVEHGTPEAFDALPAAARRRLVEHGRAYLEERVQGTSTDINARHAFRPERRHSDRAAARAALGVPPDRPLAAIYAQVWFDFPHTFAMQSFTDFLDWMRFTVDRIAAITSVTWLLKPHPCDEWYGGVRLVDLVRDVPRHVVLCPEETDSFTAQIAADAVVTVHGTVGIEAAARGLPVLNADRSHYSDWGFTHVAKSREDYGELLARIASLARPTIEQQERAMAFAAFAIAPPPARLGLLRTSCDTTEPADLYREILRRFDTERAALARERAAIADWIASGSGSYAAHQASRWIERG